MNKCLQCGKETHNPKFCSRSCSATNTNSKYIKRKGRLLFCINCGKKLNFHNSKFCSQKCVSEYKINLTIKAFLDGNYNNRVKIVKCVRDWLLNSVGNKCEKCGWGEVNLYSGNVALDIHHKDGNRKNNTLENLEVLCPNCHSLTETYKYLNKKNT